MISPDSIEYLDPESINGPNLYAYCNNDPVNYYDPSGCFPVLACILGLTALVGMGLTIGGVASDNNLMTAIGLTIVAIPSLISGVMAIFSFGAWGTMSIGGVTAVAGVGTGLFASAEYQEAFTGKNWMLDAGMSEEWYNGWREMRHHYWKHGLNQMHMSNVYSYTNSAKNIIANGKYIGGAKNAYAIYVEGKKVLYVGISRVNSLITTYSYRTYTIKKLIEFGLIVG